MLEGPNAQNAAKGKLREGAGSLDLLSSRRNERRTAKKMKAQMGLSPFRTLKGSTRPNRKRGSPSQLALSFLTEEGKEKSV